MARYGAGFRAAAIGSATIPAGSLYAPAGNRLLLRKIIVSNTTTSAVVVAVQMFTTTGTQGTGVTEIEYDNAGPPPTGTVFQSHTSGPTITAGEFDRVTLAAAEGATMVFTFNEPGLYIPAGTGNGAGITTPTGTGQILDLSYTWDE